jgi:CHAD domain-containing protein
MVARGRKIDADSPDAALHELRKQGKELRYLLELFGGSFEQKVVIKLIARLKDLQDVLGRFQDRRVQIDLLHDVHYELKDCPGGAQAMMACGLLVERLETDQREARAEFHERFTRFAAKRVRRRVKRTFR